MVRIVGIDLPKVKLIEYSLKTIYVIGLTASKTILEYENINKNAREKNALSVRWVHRRRTLILRSFLRIVATNIARLVCADIQH